MVYFHTPPSEKLQKEAEGGSGEQGKYLEEVKEMEGIQPDIDSKVRYHRLCFSVKGTHYILKYGTHRCRSFKSIVHKFVHTKMDYKMIFHPYSVAKSQTTFGSYPMSTSCDSRWRVESVSSVHANCCIRFKYFSSGSSSGTES